MLFARSLLPASMCALALAGCGARTVVDHDPEALPFETLSLSRSPAPAGLTVLASRADFELFFAAAPPDGLDLASEVVLHLSTGPKSTTGFAATIRAILLDGETGTIAVEAEDRGPADGCEVQAAANYPQAAVKIARRATSEYALRITKRADDCAETEARTPVVERCAKSTRDACTVDGDCRAGGCGGELCFGGAASSGISTCECTRPMHLACGCVEGACTWYR